MEAWKRQARGGIFMHVQMPEMDGLEATASATRRSVPPAHVPTIAMTARAMSGDPERRLEAGVDDDVTSSDFLRESR
jgi:CheY-like chemotaxis protein